MHRSILLLVIAAFFVVANAATAVAKLPAQKFKIYLNSSECLDISGGGTRPGALLIVARCAASPSQLFEIFITPSGSQTIKTSSGFCIDVPGGNVSSGSLIRQWYCAQTSEQAFKLPRWTNVSQSINIGRIFAPHSGKCFDAVARTSVKQITCIGSVTQRFYVVEVPATTAGPIATPAVTALPVANSRNAGYLNDTVRKERATIPYKVGSFEITSVDSLCAVGCDRTGTGDALAYSVKTSSLPASPTFLTDMNTVKDNFYCKSADFQTRKISIWLTFSDQFGNQSALKLLRPSDCGRAASTSNPSGNQVEDQYWDSVKNSTRAQDFQAYLNTYPGGKYAAIARLKIGQLGGNVAGTSPSTSSGSSAIEDQYWDAVKNSSRVGDFVSYLNSYPRGKYVSIARLKINQLGGSVPLGTGAVGSTGGTGGLTGTVEQQYWDAVKGSSRPQDFQNYLRDYPNGQFVPIARLRLSQLTGNAAIGTVSGSTPEEQFWNSIRNSQRAQDFQSYINNYPAGKYVALARLRIGQVGGSNIAGSVLPFPNRMATYQLLTKSQYGSLNEMLGLRQFWVITDPGDFNSKRRISDSLIKKYPRLRAANREQEADFLIFFWMTDKNGAAINNNTNYKDQTITGAMKVFTAKPGPNGAWIFRILFEVTRVQVYGTMGITFSRHPASATTGRLAVELKKIKF